IGKLGIALVRAQFVRDLERHRNDGTRIVGQRGLRHQDLMIAVGEPSDHFRGGLLARKIEEVFLDVLDLERSLVETVLLDQVFNHGKRSLYPGCKTPNYERRTPSLCVS